MRLFGFCSGGIVWLVRLKLNNIVEEQLFSNWNATNHNLYRSKYCCTFYALNDSRSTTNVPDNLCRINSVNVVIWCNIPRDDVCSLSKSVEANVNNECTKYAWNCLHFKEFHSILQVQFMATILALLVLSKNHFAHIFMLPNGFLHNMMARILSVIVVQVWKVKKKS